MHLTDMGRSRVGQLYAIARVHSMTMHDCIAKLGYVTYIHLCYDIHVNDYYV